MTLRLEDAQALAAKIEAINSNPKILSELRDDAIRRRLREAGRNLSLSMEVSGDTLHRILKSPLQLALCRIGVEKHIFEILSEADGANLTCEDIALKAKVDTILMKRFLRYYQSYGMVSQPSDDEYCANNITKSLASSSGVAGINYFFETVSPALTSLPKFLRHNGYTNPTDPTHCPWQIGHGTGETAFPWIQSYPDHTEYFLSWMAAQREGLPIFLDVMDFEKEMAQDTTESTVVFVDVGGAMGHQSIALKQRFPDLPGRIILQERPQVISQIKENPLPGFEGIEAESYDFFTPQPIKGARVYYLRNILHDWPSHKCKEILKSIKAGMTEDSVMLIDEMVLSERGAPWRAAQLDITMAACFAGMERTKAEWNALLSDVGLRLVKIWKYTEECEDCVIEAAL
ncbi:putative sterigmatocystin 8-O-methyltransferase precursor [Annulohypoxylon moriforme]|nr:putative sterigmatocystin 8-O-methyltransferase precursor [Annulohypoxylon moriforme]